MEVYTVKVELANIKRLLEDVKEHLLNEHGMYKSVKDKVKKKKKLLKALHSELEVITSIIRDN